MLATHANASAEHSTSHHQIDANAYANASKTACVSDATGHATGHATAHASTEIRDLDLCTSSTGTSSGLEGTRTEERSAAAPRYSRSESTFPSPLSQEPAPDGNYRVIERIAHEALEQLHAFEPSADVVERVKELCARRHIDYGDQVQADVVHRAVESAAVQRALTPIGKRRGGEPASLASLVGSFQRQLAAAGGKVRDGR